MSEKQTSALLSVGAGLLVACALAASGQAKAASTISVASFGARGDGIFDDTRAIQSAIDAAGRAGGGVVLIPAGTYLLNSYFPSPHPWVFYNLRIGSNVMLRGEGGAALVQGPQGRARLPTYARTVGNNVLVFGSANFPINTFQEPEYNGGFFPLEPTVADSRSVTLVDRGDAARFKPGDYVAIYRSLSGDVIPSESTQLASVSAAGVLTLKYPLARPFSSAWVVNVTPMATVNVGVSGLTVQGAMPLYVNEVFGFTASGNVFISDTSVGGGNGSGMTLNNIRGFEFSSNVVAATGPAYVAEELPQRNSQDVVIDSNTYIVATVGTGEYGAHWRINNNTFVLHPEPKSPAGLSFGGLDIVFSNNYIRGAISGGRPLVADSLASDSSMPNFGKIQIVNNTFDCYADDSTCLKVVTTDVIVQGNIFNVRTSGPPALGILIEGAKPQGVQMQSNSVSVQSGTGIIVNSPLLGNSTVSCNSVTGKGRAGIYLGPRSAGATALDAVSGNTVSGFDLLIDPGRAGRAGPRTRREPINCAGLKRPALPLR